MRAGVWLPCLAFSVAALAQIRPDGKVNVAVPKAPQSGQKVERLLLVSAGDGESKEFARVLGEKLKGIGSIQVAMPDAGDLPAQLKSLDAAQRAALAQKLGGGHLFRLKVLRVQPRREGQQRRVPTNHGAPVVINYAILTMETVGRVELLDLATGKSFEAAQISVEPFLRTEATNAPPPPPVESELRVMAADQLARKAMAQVLPWADRGEVPFIADKDAGLASVRELAAAGKLEEALAAAQQNLQSLKAANAAPKLQARAQGGVGILMLMRRQYGAAKPELEAALALAPKDEDLRTAMEVCKLALAGEAAIQALGQ